MKRKAAPTSGRAGIVYLPGAAEAAHGHCTYQLLISLGRNLRLKVGALGVLEFPEGTYAYTGSARRSLASRIARHFAGDKRLHWTTGNGHVITVDYGHEELSAEAVRWLESRLPAR